MSCEGKEHLKRGLWLMLIATVIAIGMNLLTPSSHKGLEASELEGMSFAHSLLGNALSTIELLMLLITTIYYYKGFRDQCDFTRVGCIGKYGSIIAIIMLFVALTMVFLFYLSTYLSAMQVKAGIEAALKENASQKGASGVVQAILSFITSFLIIAASMLFIAIPLMIISAIFIAIGFWQLDKNFNGMRWAALLWMISGIVTFTQFQILGMTLSLVSIVIALRALEKCKDGSPQYYGVGVPPPLYPEG